jgi:uncharacterized phage protein (TIGR02220 family)
MTDATILKTIEYLNEVTQSDYSPKYPATVNALTELMKLGYNLTDFKKVIDKKYKDWKGTKFQSYVRPSTLFGKNFENYLNEQRVTKNPIEQLKSSVHKAKQANWRLD